jgi:parvulin-like peptidyl-prolyl isomerase
VFEAVASLQQSTCGQTEGVGDTQQAACNRFALGVLIKFALVEAYATEHGVTADDARVEQTLDDFEASVGTEVLASQLQANGVTLDDVRELVRLSVLQEEVASAVTADALGEDELRRRYEENIAAYTNVHVGHILVDSRAEAEAIHDQVTAPGFTFGDFQELAKRESTDPSAAQNDGDLGKTPPSTCRPSPTRRSRLRPERFRSRSRPSSAGT